MYILRGNHETKNMTNHFTFREECIEKYDVEVYDTIIETFNCLPISALANNQYICMHGGISPEIKKVDKINDIDWFQEPPLSGLLCDLLWSDPFTDEDAQSHDWAENHARDCSYYFGKRPTQKLLDDNNLISVVRAHEVQMEGYKMHWWESEDSFPFVITIFSAPNYCGSYSNKGSVMVLADGNISIKQFDESEAPYRLPDGLNLLTWSLPFLCDKVINMLDYVIEKYADDEVTEVELPSDAKERSEIMRAKVWTVARLNKMYQTLVDE